ncbi:MAG: glutaredoxin family protein [Brevinematales bacterium]|nr:glutaredoxin family protein [Brevinematales bacterium]
MLNVYSVDWCPDCRRTINYLDGEKIEYQYIDIESSPKEVVEKVIRANDGRDWVSPTFEHNGKWMAFRSIRNEQLPGIMKELGVG